MELFDVDLGLGGGSLLQVAPRHSGQNMCYVIETPQGNLAVLDSGDFKEEDGRYVYSLLKERGGHIHTWMLSHGHRDHFGCLLWMMENIPDFDLKIDRLCFNFPPTEWFADLEGGSMLKYVDRFRRQIEERAIPVQTVYCGDVIDLGGMTADVLSDPANYAAYQTEINSSTVVWKLHFPKQDVLFLADLSLEGEIDFLKRTDAAQLRCDIVQMSHHGQNGVSHEFYKRISPRHCFWPTPLRCWYNDKGEGPGTGPWKVPETRKWMDDMGAEAHYVTGFGDYFFH